MSDNPKQNRTFTDNTTKGIVVKEKAIQRNNDKDNSFQDNTVQSTIYTKTEQKPIADILNENNKEEQKSVGKPISSNTTILKASLMLTNMCLGTSIFTFAKWTQSFGLVWILVFCLLIAIVNYWSLMNCSIASSRVEPDDYSEVTTKILGKVAKLILNIFIIVYSYACLITFFVLIYALFGRFIQSVGYQNKYNTYDDFYDDKWGKAVIKYPFTFGIAIILSFISLIKDIDKLSFTSYIGVVAVIYSLFVVMIECNKYYKHYKNNIYNKNDKSTKVNWVNLGKAFTKELNFFKGVACIIGAYCCHTGVFPVFAGFKHQEKGIRKMKFSVITSMIITTVLHFLSMICSYLTDPITPEDVIIYRKKIGKGKDIPMTIAKLFITLSLIFTLPPYFFGLRLSVANAFTKGKIPRLFNYIFTFASLIVCAFISAVYDKILNYLSYIGGFISVFICYLFPALLVIKSSGKPFTYWKNIFNLVLAIFLCAIGVIAGIRTIIDDVS